jgi:hypothetical protein
MELGYVPDQFGHVGQLPQLLAGLGLSGAVLWRGVGDDVQSTLFRWQAPDGTEQLTSWLVHGYGNGMHLPEDPTALAARLMGELRAQQPRNPVRCVLVMNGSDHLVPQPGLPAALAAAAPLLEDADATLGTLPEFLARATASASAASLPLHRGELRSGRHAPILAGCASSRLYLKRADFLNDRLLTRHLEPLAAWLAVCGGDPDVGALEAAWRTALENHPHDSICGCSIDAVHEEMETRFRRVSDWAGAHLARICGELGGHIEAPAGEGYPVAVWSPHADGVAVAEGSVELPIDACEVGAVVPLTASEASGRQRAVHAEVEATASPYARYELPASVVAALLRGFPHEFFGDPVCAWTRSRDGGRECVDVWLGESLPAEFDWQRERGEAAAALEALGDAPALFRPRRLPRLRVRLAGAFPGAGLRALRLRAGPPASAGGLRARSEHGGALLESSSWRVEVAADGRVRFAHEPTGLVVDDAVRVVSEADRGDSYSFDPLPGSQRVERPEKASVTLAPRSEAWAGIHVDALYRVPEALADDRRSRSARCVDLPVRITLGLFDGVDRVDVRTSFDNTARDHRLRLELRAPFAARRFAVESAFEVAERPIDPPPDAFGSSRPAEFPDGATPQRRFALLESDRFAFAVANRGSSEVEAVNEGAGTALAITLVRSVGWLSRDDLARRPGHAGPPLPTPGAQCPGRYTAELAVLLAPREAPALFADALRFSDPPLVFSAGASRGRLRDGSRLLEWDDPALQLSAVEPRPDGVTFIRLLHASDAPRSVQLRWNGAGSLAEADLRGRVRPGAGTGGATLRLALRPWQIISLRAG